MQIFMMDYGNLSADGKTAYLKCYGIGTFEVLSGIERYINNPDCADHEKAAIPVGGPTGSLIGLPEASTTGCGQKRFMPGITIATITATGLRCSAIKPKKTA